jgi:DNA-binding transcriptional regulator of glucitol operon
MEILVALVIALASMWAVSQMVAGRFNKAIYSFEQYGIDFKIIKKGFFYHVVNCDNLVFYKDAGIVDLPHYKQFSVEDIKEAAHELVAQNYPFEREEWEEIERQTAEVVAAYQKLDEKMAEDLKNGIQPDWKDHKN